MSTTISRRGLVTGLLVGGLAARARAAGPPASPPGMRRLIANENPYGPSPAAQATARQAIAESWKYAVRETATLKAAIAQREDVPAEQVLVSAGSSEALRVGALALVGTGGEIVAPMPTFTFLPDYVRELGGRVIDVPLDAKLGIDLEAIAAALTPQTRLVYLCNPNNPTGTRLAAQQVQDFIADISPRVPVLVDEAYLDIDPDWRAQTAVNRVRAGDAVLVTRTFSKLHGMAGLRVGYAVGPAAMIARLEALRVSQMSFPGVLAATASLDDAEFRAFSRAQIRDCIATTTGVLDELNRPYARPYGNFVFFDTGGSAREFAAGMRQRGIITGMPSAAYPGWARVSMGRVEDMEAFAAAARSYFRGNA